MPISAAAALGSAPGLSFFSNLTSETTATLPHLPYRTSPSRSRRHFHAASVSASGDVGTQAVDQAPIAATVDGFVEESLARGSADWKTASSYKESGSIFQGRVENSNGGGLIIRFCSLVGFLPYPQISPARSCREPDKTIQEIGRALIGSAISVKIIQAEQEGKKLIFSEKEAEWSKFSQLVNVGDIFEGRVGSVEDYGAFVHLRLPDGDYHLTGLVHVSEVSWDLVQDVRDVLTEGDEVRVKVTKVDREKSRITLSIKQLEEDPLLETLDKVIPQNGSPVSGSSGTTNSYNIEPLPGLEAIFKELLLEEGIADVRITRQGFEKRVVSQDLQLWLSNAPPIGNQFTLLARAGRQVQEIQLTTTLDQEGIKRALQHVLERVP